MQRGYPIVTGESEWKTAVRFFLNTHDVADSSRKTYGWCLSHFFNWVNATGRNIATLTENDILVYKQFLLQSDRSVRTTTLYISVLKMFFRWAEGRGVANLAKDVKLPRTKSAPHFVRLHLEPDQVAMLLKEASGSVRDFAMISLMVRTGMRVIEVVRADVGDIRTYRGHRVLLIWGKGMDRKPTEVTTESKVILTEKAASALDAYLATRPLASPDTPLFLTDGKGHRGERMTTRCVEKIVRKYLDAIGCYGPDYSTHSLRHTMGVNLLKATGDIREAQKVLRHSSSSITEIYVESIREQERMEKAVENVVDTLY